MPKSPQEFVHGLSDPALARLMAAGLAELLDRWKPDMSTVISPQQLLAYQTGPEPVHVAGGLVNPLGHEPSIIADGRLVVAYDNRRVEIDGKIIEITGKPYGVLAVLAANADRIVSEDFLLHSVWDSRSAHQNAAKGGKRHNRLGATLHRLRQRLGINDLGHPETGVIQSIPYEGWVALSSLKNSKQSTQS